MICSACQAPNDAAAGSCIACGQPLVAEPASPKPGALFAGRYQILSVLGRGGMGMVYKAHDVRLDETIALKVIRPDLARESRLHDRFRSEIKLARRIRHRNVCSIYGDGEEQGILWVCMELVEGVDLRQLVRERGGLPPREAFLASIQIAEGLGAIHDVGIIHRDLKTANVMRDERGVVRLMDFGLAKQWRAEDSGGLTANGHVVGTPDYMSPEQARGEKLTFASDLYALGVITFELFTGEPPFRGDTPLTTLLKHLHDPPPLEGDAGRRLPKPLVPALRRLLAKQPHERPASAVEAAQALRAARQASLEPDGATPTFLKTLSQDGKGAPTEPMPAVPPASAGPSVSWTRAFTAVKGKWGWGIAPLAGAVLVAASVLILQRSAPRPESAPLLSRGTPPPPATIGPSASGIDVPAGPALTMPAAPATALPTALVPTKSSSPTLLIDVSGAFIQFDPIGCFVAGQFPLLHATVRDPGSISMARVYFASALGSTYYYVEMMRVGRRFTGKLPKPTLEASPISYHIDAAWSDGRTFRTREVRAPAAASAAECPPGSRIAEFGPPGPVTVFGPNAMVVLRDALSVDALVNQLKDSDASVREAAAEALRAIIPSVKAVVEKAVAELRDADPEVREDAADDLEDVSEIVVKEAMIPLIAVLKDKDPAVQIKAADSLGEIGPLVAAAAKALRVAIRDPEARVRRSATKALSTIGSVVGATLAALERVPGEDANPKLRRAARTAHSLIEKAGQ